MKWPRIAMLIIGFVLLALLLHTAKRGDAQSACLDKGGVVLIHSGDPDDWTCEQK